jgi:hypothetical protein
MPWGCSDAAVPGALATRDPRYQRGIWSWSGPFKALEVLAICTWVAVPGALATRDPRHERGIWSGPFKTLEVLAVTLRLALRWLGRHTKGTAISELLGRRCRWMQSCPEDSLRPVWWAECSGPFPLPVSCFQSVPAGGRRLHTVSASD